MRYFPAFIDVAGHPVVLVGSGEAALRKARLLVKTEARLTIIADAPSGELERLAAGHGARLLRTRFEPAHLDAARLVFVATRDQALIELVSAAAAARAIPTNVVDAPEASTFVVPAIVDRDPVVVAVGSEGDAPVLARDIRARIEAMLPANLGLLARRARNLRDHVAAAFRDPARRRHLWEKLLRGPWRDAVLSGDDIAAKHRFDAEIASAGATEAGSVVLVGAGPGDPDLITLRAQQHLQDADVIVYDGLVPAAVLEHARRDAIRIRAGKEGYGISTDQAEINRILVREARKGQKVVRLKGGDPFVFGRASEEMAAVRAAGLRVAVVPGITAAHAAAASIGLPVTLREKVRHFSIATGATAGGLPDLDWKVLARPGHAFAIYMGLRNAPAIASSLVTAGAAPDLPVVVVANATLPAERVIATTLVDLPGALDAAALVGPAVIFVGLDWKSANLTKPARVEDFSSVSNADAIRAVYAEASAHAASAGEIAPAAH